MMQIQCKFQRKLVQVNGSQILQQKSKFNMSGFGAIDVMEGSHDIFMDSKNIMRR